MSLKHAAHRLQDRLLHTLGRSPADRGAVVRKMLQPGSGETAGYWLQLVIATMLATLGLALNSTAVVIGAMLIAPLMRPLVELAMGLATGSAGLVLRALLRTAVSIVICICVAFLITWVLPFHEITSELEARTAPSLLDLAVAGACALAAAYAALRADADIATTAAGTSIGISLVPPLCAVGYGIAINGGNVWRGAALLFTANLSGILALATVVFLFVGFSQVDVRSEEDALEGSRVGRSLRIGRAWSSLTRTRLGAVYRFIPPLALLGMVSIPLERAIGEIRRRSDIRTTVSRALSADQRRIVQYTLDQPSSGVLVRAVVVGDAATASELETDLKTRLRALEVKDAKISVWAVPDAAAVSALQLRVDSMPAPTVVEPVPQVARRYSTDVLRGVRTAWPTSGTGPLLGIWNDLDHPDRVRLIHLGAPLGSAGIQLLARTLLPLGTFELHEDALLSITAPIEDGTVWLRRALALVERSASFPDVHLCLTVPDEREVSPRGDKRDVVKLNERRTQVLELLPSNLPRNVAGDAWSIVPQVSPCVSAESPP